jgi:streptogramin lyase
MKKFMLIFPLLVLATSGFGQMWTHYNTGNSLISSKASYIECDADNNIWVTEEDAQGDHGLVKFDGTTWEQFTDINSGLAKNDVRRVRADKNGNLWICYHGGLNPNETGLTKYDGQTWTHYNVINDGMISNQIFDIEIDENDNVWMSSELGLSVFNQDSFINYLLPHFFIYEIAIKDTAHIWFQYSSDTFNIGLGLFNPYTNNLDTFHTGNSNIPTGNIFDIRMDNNGMLWIACMYGFKGISATADGSNFNTWMPPFANSITASYGIYPDSENNTWVLSRCEGLFLYDNTSWTNVVQVPDTGCAASIVEDKHGYIWYVDGAGVWTNKPALSKEAINSSKINIFPNPASKKIFVNANLQAQSTTTLSLFNIQAVEQISMDLNQQLNEIDISNLSDGIYFIRVTNDTFSTTQKIVKTGKPRDN